MKKRHFYNRAGRHQTQYYKIADVGIYRARDN